LKAPSNKLQLKGSKDTRFLFDGPLRLAFFGVHLDSTKWRHGLRARPNESSFRPALAELGRALSVVRRRRVLSMTYNRYVPIPGSTKTANCSYLEIWDSSLKKRSFRARRQRRGLLRRVDVSGWQDSATTNLRRSGD